MTRHGLRNDHVRGSRTWAAAALVLIAVIAAPQAPESAPHLAIYSTQNSFSVALGERDGRAYVSIGDVLQPLGEMRVEDNGRKWKAKFNRQELHFEEGKSKAKVRGKDIDLGAKFAVESGRGLVPMASLPAVLTPLLGARVELHETARRLFIGDAAMHFTAEAAKPNLTLNFSAPVNPTITTEAGHVRLRFAHEPLVGAQEKQSFDDKTITYTEANGAAELNVTSSVPLLATFSNGNRSITLVPAPHVAQTPPPATPPALPPAVSAPSLPAPEVAAPAPVRMRVTILLDAAHGGDERGAALTDRLAEKDVTLAFARRLRAELAARGVSAGLLRDGDALIGPDQRAAAANAPAARRPNLLPPHSASARSPSRSSPRRCVR